MFVLRFQPVFIVIILIIITFLYSYIIYKVIGTFWFRYILLIVMLTGVLVVFTYIVTLIPNETFEVYGLVFLFILVGLFIVVWINYYNDSLELVSIGLWSTYLSFFRLFLVRFLLGVILMVVSLRYINDGAFKIK